MNTATALATIRKPPKEALHQLEKVVIEGNLAVLTPQERVGYYARVCESLGLNPLTRPFEYITLNGKLTLYPRKDATDQLRQINAISIDRLERERDADMVEVTAYGHDRRGRTDSAIGAVSVTGLKGEALANAIMKAETKAKRRLTLSLAGLGWLDESEVVDLPLVASVSVDPATGEVEGGSSKSSEVRQRLTARTHELRQAVVEDPPADEPTPKKAKRQPAPEPEPDPPSDDADASTESSSASEDLDPSSIPFDSGAADANDDEASHANVVAAAPGTSAPEADQPVGQDQVPPAAPVSEADACDHPTSERVVREAGVVCTICGSILASYGGRPSAPSDAKPARLPGSREAVMARLHVSRTHEEVRAIAAAVLGLDPEKPWSMTDLFDEDLAQVLAAVRTQDQQRTTHAARPRREAAAAGGRRRS